MVWRGPEGRRRRQWSGLTHSPEVLPLHEAQLLTYLRLGGWRVGLLLNFNVPVLKRGIRRLVL
jgi:GxxExxY protein